MRLTLINQFYTPDLAPTGHMAASMAKHRAALGDQVTVITGSGGYVSTSNPAPRLRQQNPKVIRLWTPRLGKATWVNRLVDYGAFYLLAALRMLFLPRQDVIISLTTPPFIAWTAVLHQRLHPGTKLVLWNMDCYPEIAERTGVIQEGGWLSRRLRGLNRRLFKRLDRVVCLDRAMQDLLRTHYAHSDPGPTFHIIPNWEPSEQFPADLAPPPCDGLSELALENAFVVLYLGNAGFGHRFETVLEAADRMRQEPFLFLFVGGGQKWPWLEEAARRMGLRNLILRPYVPKEATPAVLAMADCALITMSEVALGLISPSKLHANLAMGLPVLYIGPEGSNVDDAIKSYGFGLSIRHGEVDPMVGFLRSLRDDRALHLRYRAAARRAFEAAFSDEHTLPLFDQVLSALLADAG